MTDELVFLKLGGSLITDKNRPYTARTEKLAQLAQEIKSALDAKPTLKILLGHGSGSFGHVAAKKHGTREGVRAREQWLGFVEVRYQAAELNRLVVQALLDAELPALPFPPSASILADERKASKNNVDILRRALDANLLPVVYGDVAFDATLGGTILSTEDIFAAYVPHFAPKRILLAGLEAGVWEDFPARTKLLKQIRPSADLAARGGIQGSASADVTGGMKSKVEEMLALVQANEGLSAQIFSAEERGALTRALRGENMGTLLTA
ncbi:MAG: isopentenyl phosphate kinase family protein [Anaerolineales bacterium]|nr:isopentenyl phosphate kinase family protein [Anaerolineales bacterium]